MTERQKAMRAECRQTFGSYVENVDEAARLGANALGRRTLESGASLLDMAEIVMSTFSDAIRCSDAAGTAKILDAAESFLLECFSPFEMALRGATEANRGLRSQNERMEEQVKRIAHEIHDSSAQFLASVHTELQRTAEVAPSELAPRLHRIRSVLSQVETDLRRYSHELRPTILDDLGLIPALHELSRGFGERSGLVVVIEGPQDERFPPAIEIALYRTVQEALTNVGKHARAHRVNVRIENDNREVRCSIADDGSGVSKKTARTSATQRGIGLIGIRERLATLGGTVAFEEGADGRGTRLTASIPLEVSHVTTRIDR